MKDMRACSDFLNLALIDSHSIWEDRACRALSSHSVPSEILGTNREVLLHDVNHLWSGWYIDSFIRKEYLKLESKILYFRIFKDVFTSIKCQFNAGYSAEDAKELASTISTAVEARVEYFKISKMRKTIPKEAREFVKEQVLKNPRCWITGYEFPEESIEKFFFGHGDESKPLPFFDNIMPIGSKPGDLNIEIDHLYPFSKGGDHEIYNFKPVSRWANRIKSDNCLIYDQSLVARSINEIKEFWLLRTMATKRSCSQFGCNKNSSNSRLVAASNNGGMITPTSIRLFCPEHDPARDERWISNNWQQ